MELSEFVRPEYLRLLKKLGKDGIASIADLPYEFYMRTALWKKIRLWVLERDDGRCVVCGKKGSSFSATEVHHRDYRESTLIGEAPEMLVSLCASCHTRVEYFDAGSRRKDLQEKDARLVELSEIHKEIVKMGMPIEYAIREAHGVTNIDVVYVGPSSFLQFYSLASDAYLFCVHIMRLHREKLTLPMPFGREKLLQDTGAKIITRDTRKPVATVWADHRSIRVKESKSCWFPVASELPAFLLRAGHWKIHEPGTSEP